jgi:hypothetical protein
VLLIQFGHAYAVGIGPGYLGRYHRGVSIEGRAMDYPSEAPKDAGQPADILFLFAKAVELRLRVPVTGSLPVLLDLTLCIRQGRLFRAPQAL